MPRHWTHYALAMVAVLGWSFAGFLAWAMVYGLQWFGVMLIGLVVVVAAQNAELFERTDGAESHLLEREYRETRGGSLEARLRRWTKRLKREEGCYVARTIGIALALLGLNMAILHQL